MVLVLDDHPIARQGLESIIKIHKPDVQILQAGTVKEGIDLTEKSQIDMAFIDIHLHNESGFDFLEWVQEKEIDMKTFVITSSSNENDFLRAKCLGIDAYLLKDAFIDDIVYGLKVVERGGKFYSADLIENVGNVSEEEKKIDMLTRREVEVITLLRKGYSNAKIGEVLYVSEGTVKKHLSNIFGKLDLYNRAEAMLFAERNSEKLQLTLKAV
ncbi:response regulator [Peptoanaerobacter stomatis]|uniref:response regulator n=1 Tax=Peptoanaerobacter stomatis TaxID=796937 RepID=UPI003FA08C0A